MNDKYKETLICPNCGNAQFVYDEDDPGTLFKCTKCKNIFAHDELTGANKNLLNQKTGKIEGRITEQFSIGVNKMLKKAFKGNMNHKKGVRLGDAVTSNTNKMSTPINKIIYYKNADNTYLHNIFDLKEEYMLPYAANEYQELAPPGGLMRSLESRGFCDQPLFNNAGFCNIMESLGKNGAPYIELQLGKMLSEIHVEPDDLMVDLLITKDSGLLYQFYNVSGQDAVSVKIKIDQDKEGIYSKIKAHSDDLEYRQFFLKKALKKPGVKKIQEPKIEYPDLMTAEQVAEYLQVSLQTVRNKTSSGELRSVIIAGLRRYKISDL